MAFPKTVDELRDAGYRFSDHGVCRGCKADIEWWHSPNRKPIPFDLMNKANDFTATTHWATCPEKDQFRKRT